MYKGIEHIAIASPNTPGLRAWYCVVFDAEVVYDNKKEPPTYFVRLGGGPLLEILPAGDAPPHPRGAGDPGISHLAVAVDDFDAACADLGSKGICVENIREAGGGVKVGFFSDPEGNLLQVIYRPKPL